MMRKAGEILFETRLKANISIEDVYEGTKIRPSYIEAIEKSNYSEFHSDTTVKGFLRNYAVFLGLNPENIIALYRREQSYREKTHDKKWDIKLPKFHISPTLFVIVASILIIASVIGFFTFKYVEVSVPPNFDVIAPIDQSTTTDDKVVVRVLAVQAQGIDVFINNKPITTLDEKGDYFTTIDLAPGENQITVTAINGYKKQTTKNIKVYRQNPQNIETTNVNASMKYIDTQAGIINYTVDATPTISKNFNPGETVSFVMQSKVTISGTARISRQLEVMVNNTRVTLLADKSSQQISYVFNKDKNTYEIQVTPLP